MPTKKLSVARKALHLHEEEEAVRPAYEAEDRKFLAHPMPDFSKIKVGPS